MNKKCIICNDDFTTTKYRLYCSTKCQREARVGILVPDPKKKSKYKLKESSSQKWTSKLYDNGII